MTLIMSLVKIRLNRVNCLFLRIYLRIDLSETRPAAQFDHRHDRGDPVHVTAHMLARHVALI